MEEPRRRESSKKELSEREPSKKVLSAKEPIEIPISKPEETNPARRIDYIIVVDRNIKKSQFYRNLVIFFNYLQVRGIRVELGFGNIEENIYVKLHITEESVKNFASIYNIDIENVGHTFISVSTINLKICQTPLTLGNDMFYRKGEATSTERILIMYQLLSAARFGDHDGDNKYGVQKLLRIGAIKDVYPLHDGPFAINEENDAFLNDRQLLLKYWANFAVLYKDQPLNLIEKYFGSEVAFYFAWLGFYNTMLIPAAIVGLICFIAGVVLASTSANIIEIIEEVHTSKLKLCPRCTFGHSCFLIDLSGSYTMAKILLAFDNYATVFFAVFMSFWASTFISLWNRFENILKIRWNVTSATITAKTQTRLPYREKATNTRISHITGQEEHYTPFHKQMFYYILSFGACLLLVSVVLVAVMGVITYRIIMVALMRMSDSVALRYYAPFIESCTSSILQVIFIKFYGTFYAPLSEWLTNMENPRTQVEFDNSVIHKRYILGFANNYASLFYMAFFKGRFYWPAYMSVGSWKTDVCHPCGCILALCVQLFVLMLLKSMAGNILTLVVPIITRKCSKKRHKENVPQWEEEFLLYPAGRYLLTTEFMEMIIQYGFVTFFAAAFPLAPVCAIINNCLELRLDALKLVTRYRRPVPQRQSGIETWRNILEVITHFSVATNAFVLSFTSNFVSREIYRYYHDGSLVGYINSTLSVFDLAPFKDSMNTISGMEANITECYYVGSRYPPDHPLKYKMTPKYWHEFGMRLLCVILFEHVIMGGSLLIMYLIPEVPRKIEKALFYENTRYMESVFQALNEEAKKARRNQMKSKIKLE